MLPSSQSEGTKGARIMKRLLRITCPEALPDRPNALKNICRLLLTISFCLSASIIAQADPLTLTGGTFTAFQDFGFWHNQANAGGPDISISCGASNNFYIGGCPNPFILSSLLTPIGTAGSVTINGQTYDAFVGSFSFTDTTITGSIGVFADRNP